MATAANWLANFVVTLTFLHLVDAFGQTAAFWGFAVLCVLSIRFTLRDVPETLDRSLEDIETQLGTVQAGAARA